ncbi:MAG: hypothetical protein ACPLVI_07910, partial [Thermoplasmata archaeon]
NLIPAGSLVYPGVSTEYSLYLGTQLLTVSVSGTTETTFSTSTGSIIGLTFTVPAIPGLQNLAVVYAGTTKPLSSIPVVVSTPGTSYGTIQAIYSAKFQKLYIVGYNFAPSYSFKLYYMTYWGVENVPKTADSSGAFVYTTSLSEPAGTYSVFMQSSSGTPLGTPVTYTVTPYFVNLYGGYMPVLNDFPVTAYGLQPDTYYYLFLNNTYVDEQLSDPTGRWSNLETVPLVPAGTYTLSLAPASSPSTPVLSQPFVVVPNSAIILSTMSQFAFPGQLVQFSAYVGSISAPPGATITGYFASITLNGTVFANVPATYSNDMINGSFRMPNNLPGSYYLLGIEGFATYTYTQQITTSEQLPLGATAYTTTASTGTVRLTVTFIEPNYGSFSTAAINGPGNYKLGTSPYYAVVTAYSAPSSSAGSITFSIATIPPLTSTYADTITSSPTTITVRPVPLSGSAQSYPPTLLTGTYVTYISLNVQTSGIASSAYQQFDFFGLAQGNGALLTGITPSEMATLQAQISSTISTSMQ